MFSSVMPFKIIETLVGGGSDNIGEVDTITEANSPLSLSSAGIVQSHTTCSGSIFSRKVEIKRAKENELAIANLQMLNHVLRLWELNCGGADMFCQN